MERLSLAVDKLNAKIGRDSVAWGVMPNSARAFSGTKIAFARIPDMEEFYE
jgi:DNA polymerase-4